MLLDGEADLVYIYSDQPKNIIDQCKKGAQDEKTNCTMWEQFGSAYAFVQTGKFGWVQNGTTLAMTKKGSGVDAALNSCIHKFMESKEYYDLCTKYPTLLHECYPNSHFPPMGDDQAPYLMPTDELAASNHTCATGYCPCDTAMSTTVKTGATGTTDESGEIASSGATSWFQNLMIDHEKRLNKRFDKLEDKMKKVKKLAKEVREEVREAKKMADTKTQEERIEEEDSWRVHRAPRKLRGARRENAGRHALGFGLRA